MKPAQGFIFDCKDGKLWYNDATGRRKRLARRTKSLIRKEMT